MGEEAHPSIFKALGLLGFGRNRVVRVPVDGQGRMRADALPPSPARDSLSCRRAMSIRVRSIRSGEIIRARQGRGAWVHVDGAFGLWAAASPR